MLHWSQNREMDTLFTFLWLLGFMLSYTKHQEEIKKQAKVLTGPPEADRAQAIRTEKTLFIKMQRKYRLK